MAHAEQVSPSHLCDTRCRASPDITGHIRTVSYRGVKNDRRGRKEPVPDRVPYRRSRAKGAGAGHGVGDGRRVRYRRSPDRVRYGPSLTHVPSHPGPPWRPHVSAVFTVGCAERPSSAMPRPNSACHRRRHRRSTNMFSFTPPWRSLGARSAARLRRGVGPLASRKAVAGRFRQ